LINQHKQQTSKQIENFHRNFFLFGGAIVLAQIIFAAR
jgi:hypothetical protein